MTCTTLASLCARACVPRFLELLEHDVACVRKVGQALLERIVDVRIVCRLSVAVCCVSHCERLPYVWMRRCIFGSAGCGIEYPQNSTSGLNQRQSSSARHKHKSIDALLHDHVSQGVAERVLLVGELKRRCCVAAAGQLCAGQSWRSVVLSSRRRTSRIRWKCL